MANRRMFSNRIANSAKFLQMPAETQLLYFHMVMRADDDGVVEAYPLLKLLGLAPDNFKVLVAKGFIRQLNEDQVIVIKDWIEHNTIRADRKVNSIYFPLLIEKFPDQPLVIPKERSDVEDNSQRLGGPSTDGISQVKLSKVNIDPVEETSTKGFNFEEELKNLKDSKRKDYKIIALYWRKKNWVFENRDQFNAAFVRELRAAKSLKGYSGEQIGRSMNYCINKFTQDMWTLETVAKRITDLINSK